MRSHRWTKLVFGLVFGVALATGGRAQAQWGYPGFSFAPYGGQFGAGYGGSFVFDASPYGYGAFPGISSGIPGQYGFFPGPGYGLATGQVPQTVTSFQGVSNAVTLVPGWGGSSHGAYHRNQPRSYVPRRVQGR